MPLSVEHFKQAAAQYPDAEALINLPENTGIISAKAPRMGILGIFSPKSYFDELEKSRAIVSDFKTALKEKYGRVITAFAFPLVLKNMSATSSLTSCRVTTVLKKAELMDLLMQAIVDTITDEQSEPEPADSPFRNVPGEGQRIFSKQTVQLIKNAYYECFEAAFKATLQLSDIDPRMLLAMNGARGALSMMRSQEAVQSDLQRAGLGDSSLFVSRHFPVKAMLAAMENNIEVNETILARFKTPVPAQASYTRAPQRSPSMAAASIATSSETSTPISEATPVSPVQSAVRIDDPEWNI